MGILEAFVTNFTEGVLSGLKSGGTKQIEGLCNALRWAANVQDEATVVVNFNDGLAGGQRKLVILCNDVDLALFSAYSASTIPCDHLPREVLGYLLTRNKELGLGAWQICADENGNARIGITYSALAAGLTLPLFHCIALTLIEEAHEFDTKMRDAGMLQINY
jgi:hypothetical protein